MTCNNCGRNPCNCMAGGMTPIPFYAQAPSCAQSHQQPIYINQYAVGLQVQSAWNVPVCGGAAILSVPGVITIPIGEYIHNPTYGYFLITAFDPSTGQLSIQNPCFTDNVAPGTKVSECTVFSITPPPCCDDSGGGGSGVCVKYDFTAPAEGDCVDIIVTEQTGLIVGYLVTIGSGVYALNAIKADDVITICNQGSGITPGTPVIAQNVEGQYQYCLVQTVVSPCSQAAGPLGKVMVCIDETPTTLLGSADGQIVQLQTAATGVAHYVSVTDAVEPVICAINASACCDQIVAGDIPLVFITQNVTFTDQFFKYDFPTPLKTITITDACNYAVLSQVTVGVQLDFISGSDTPTPILGEVQLLWDNNIGPFTYSKMAWQDIFDDGWDVRVGAPGDASSIQQLLVSSAPRYPMMYHAQQIESFATIGNGSVNLGGSVRITVGDNFTPSNVYTVKLMLSGWVKIFRT